MYMYFGSCTYNILWPFFTTFGLNFVSRVIVANEYIMQLSIFYATISHRFIELLWAASCKIRSLKILIVCCCVIFHARLFLFETSEDYFHNAYQNRNRSSHMWWNAFCLFIHQDNDITNTISKKKDCYKSGK